MQDTASELMYPLLPILLTVVLGAPAVVVGLVEGVAEGVAALMKFVAGRLADRYPKVPLVFAGYGLAAIGKAFVAAAWAWPLVLLGRSVDRVGKGIRGAPRDALLVDGIPVEARGRAFGLHRAADTTGAVIGPLIALGGYELLNHHLRPLLWIAIVPAVISVLLVFFLREPGNPPPPPGLGTKPAPATRPAKDRTKLPASFWRVVGVLGVFGLVNFPDALILLHLKNIGFTVETVVLAYVFYNLVYAGLSYPAGVVADRLSPRLVVGVGLLVFAVVYGGLGLTNNHAVAWLLLAGYGAYTGLTDGVGKAWISSLLPADRQGGGQGIFQGVSGAAVLLAGLWAGLAWGSAGSLPLVISGTAAGLIGMAVIAYRS